MKQRVVLVLATLVVLIASFVGVFLVLHRTPGAAQANGSNGDWPMFMGDITRSGMNTNETLITPATASTLHYSWMFTTGGPVVSSPVIVNGIMYIGSWDGYEYAINVSTRQLVWKQFLGITQQKKLCYGKSVGVTATAAVQNNVLYVGGGDGNLYALNTADGSVIWKTLLGLPPYYNYSSPLLYNNRVYIGLASYCDPPYTHGKMLAFNTSDGSLAASVDLVPVGQTGATVWSSPAVDATTNTIYVTTGNNGSKSTTAQPLSEAIVALDATTLTVKDHWQIPLSQQVLDSDFGATPTIFDWNGQQYVSALNKNGVYYAWNRTDLAAGPVWEQIMSGNSNLVQGDNVSPSCYNNGILYAASAGGTFNGTAYGGSLSAFNVATGTASWTVHMLGATVAPVTCLNGLIIDNQSNVVEVRNAATGAILFRHALPKRIEGASVVSNGVLYVPCYDGNIYAFALSSSPTPTTAFQDNFDSYTPGPLPTGSAANQWTAANVKGTGFAINVSNTVANSAPNALQFTMGSGLKGDAVVLKKYGATSVTYAAKFSLYLDPTLSYTNSIDLFNAQNQANRLDGSVTIWLAVNHSLVVMWYDSLGHKHSQGIGTASKLTTGQWYTIEIDQSNDSTNGSWSLWLNGTQLATQTGIDMGNVGINAVRIGALQPSTAAMSGTFFIDDVITSPQHIG